MLKIVILFCMLQGILFASLKDTISNKCPKEYSKYSNNIENYLIRMEEDIKNKGCKVIPIYASIIESEKIDILDELEEDNSLMAKLLKIL